MRRIGLFIVREDLVKSTLSSFIAIVSVATLKTLQLWLQMCQLGIIELVPKYVYL
jgi:hypothetical protein